MWGGGWGHKSSHVITTLATTWNAEYVCVTAELAALLSFHLLDGGAGLHNLDATLGCLLLRGGNTSPRMGPAAGSRVYGPEERRIGSHRRSRLD